MGVSDQLKLSHWLFIFQQPFLWFESQVGGCLCFPLKGASSSMAVTGKPYDVITMGHHGGPQRHSWDMSKHSLAAPVEKTFNSFSGDLGYGQKQLFDSFKSMLYPCLHCEA